MADSQSQEFYSKVPFNLQEGEVVKDQIKPIWMGYFLYNVLGSIIAAIIVSVIAAIYALALGAVAAIAVFFLILIVVVGLAGIGSYISYNKYQVWISDQRIISARGFIGYTTESMPLENINDVIINRSIVDRILNLSSVRAVPIGGMVMYGRRGGFNTTGYIPALHPDDANRIQKEIFDLRNSRKKALASGI